MRCSNTASVRFMLTVFGYPLAAAGWGRDPSRILSDVTLATVLSGGYLLEQVPWRLDHHSHHGLCAPIQLREQREQREHRFERILYREGPEWW